MQADARCWFLDAGKQTQTVGLGLCAWRGSADESGGFLLQVGAFNYGIDLSVDFVNGATQGMRDMYYGVSIHRCKTWSKEARVEPGHSPGRWMLDTGCRQETGLCRDESSIQRPISSIAAPARPALNGSITQRTEVTSCASLVGLRRSFASL